MCRPKSVDKPGPAGASRFVWSLLVIALAIGTLVAGVQTAGAAADGTGVLSSVTPTSAGACTVLNGCNSSVYHYDVQQGDTYTGTLTGVTECSGSSISVAVKSTSTGNQCVTATGGSGTYTFSVTMPAQSCETYPVEYSCGDTCANG